MDLDEIIEQKSSESLVKLMTQKSSYLDFFYNYSITRLDLDNYNQKKEFAKIILSELSNLKDKFDRELMLEKLSQSTQFTRDQLLLLQDKPNQVVTVKPVKSKKSDIKKWAEKEIIGQMLLSQQATQDFKLELGYFINEDYQRLALTIINYYRNHDELVIADFISTIDDTNMIELVTQIVDSDIYFNIYSKEALQDAILEVKISNLDIQIAEFTSKYRDELSLNPNSHLWNEYQVLKETRKDLIQKKGVHNHGK